MPTIDELLKMTEGVTEKQNELDRLAATQTQGTRFRNEGQSGWDAALGKGTPAQTQAMLAMLSEPTQRGQNPMQALGSGFNKGMALRDNILEKQKMEKVRAAELGVKGSQDTLKNMADIYGMQEGAEEKQYDRARQKKMDEAEAKKGTKKGTIAFGGRVWQTEDGVPTVPLGATEGQMGREEAMQVAQQKAEEAAIIERQTLKTAKRNAAAMAGMIQNDIDMIREDIGFMTTGLTGNLSAAAGAGPAYEQETQFSQLKAKLSMDKLAALRAASTSGSSGLGQLTAPELKMLENSLATLSLGQSAEKQEESLKTIEKYYAKAIEDYATIFGTEGGAGPVGKGAAPGSYTSSTGVTFTVSE